jgi:hypothetical protein
MAFGYFYTGECWRFQALDEIVVEALRSLPENRRFLFSRIEIQKYHFVFRFEF